MVLGIAIVVLPLVILVINQVGTVQNSVVAFSDCATWFPFSMFIAITWALLPVHVATGLTRRTFSRGALVAAAVTGLVYGAVYSTLLLIERTVFGALGWEWEILEGLVPYASDGQAFVVASCLTSIVAYVSGFWSWITYQRVGGWWGDARPAADRRPDLPGRRPVHRTSAASRRPSGSAAAGRCSSPAWPPSSSRPRWRRRSTA